MSVCQSVCLLLKKDILSAQNCLSRDCYCSHGVHCKPVWAWHERYVTELCIYLCMYVCWDSAAGRQIADREDCSRHPAPSLSVSLSSSTIILWCHPDAYQVESSLLTKQKKNCMELSEHMQVNQSGYLCHCSSLKSSDLQMNYHAVWMQFIEVDYF